MWSGGGLSAEMLQDMFFTCIESLVRTQLNRQQTEHGAKRDLKSVLQTKTHFERMAEKKKAEVLVNFVQNKAVLQAIYASMFSQQSFRQNRKLSSSCEPP